jgi:uncharacterized protein YbjT (DUF2867 family)
MWTNINQVYATKDSQNGWAHIAADNKWHRILPGAADGVTNVFLLLSSAKANNRQAYVVLDANNRVIAAYM